MSVCFDFAVKRSRNPIKLKFSPHLEVPNGLVHYSYNSEGRGTLLHNRIARNIVFISYSQQHSTPLIQ